MEKCVLNVFQSNKYVKFGDFSEETVKMLQYESFYGISLRWLHFSYQCNFNSLLGNAEIKMISPRINEPFLLHQINVRAQWAVFNNETLVFPFN
jgi:hypothetical protein